MTYEGTALQDFVRGLQRAGVWVFENLTIAGSVLVQPAGNGAMSRDKNVIAPMQTYPWIDLDKRASADLTTSGNPPTYQTAFDKQVALGQRIMIGVAVTALVLIIVRKMMK